MHTLTADMPLSPLTQWSQEHIRKIFESRYDTEAVLAVDQTFATSLRGTINGKDLTYDDVKQLALAVRNASPSRSLTVEWQNANEVPADAQNCVSAHDPVHNVHFPILTIGWHFRRNICDPWYFQGTPGLRSPCPIRQTQVC
jgi:hypothetical protein